MPASQIREYHLNKGWDEVGYHWLVNRHGFVVRGRDQSTQGAHALGLNAESLGICCIGDYEDSTPSFEMMRALESLLTALCMSLSIPVTNIIAHRDVAPPGRKSSTRCPGDKLYQCLGLLRESVERGLTRAKSAQVERELVLSELALSRTRLVLTGLCWNTGSEPWRSSVDAPFRVGAKLFLDSELVWEGRNPLPLPSLIGPGEAVPFALEHRAEFQSDRPYVLELDILQESRFWGRDVGCQPLSLSFSTQPPEDDLPDLPAQVQATLDLYQLRRGAILEGYGRIKNSGERLLAVSNGLTARLLISSSAYRLEQRINCQLSRDKIMLGECCEVFGQLDIRALKAGLYLLTLEVLLQDPESNSEQLLAQKSLYVEIDPAKITRKSGIYDYGMWVERRLAALEGVCTFGGEVVNSGLLPWSSISLPGDHPVRIVAELYDQSDTRLALQEKRYELDKPFLQPGETLAFHFDFETPGLKSGGYFVRFDVLREGLFRFGDLGSRPTELAFEVNTPQHLADSAAIERHDLLPIASSQALLLVIAPNLPLYDREAGGAQVLQLLEIAKSLGIPTILAVEKWGIPDPKPYLAKLKELGIETILGPLEAIAQLRKTPPSACLLCWYTSAVNFLSLIRANFPSAKVIINSADIHWLRHQRGMAAGLLKMTQHEFETAKHAELSAYRRADEIWVVSAVDRAELLSELPAASVREVPHLSSADWVQHDPGNSEGVLFVGGFAHPPNESAAQWGWEICETYRRKSGRRFTYYIVGANPPSSLTKLHDGVHTVVTGHVADLSAYFKRSRVLLAALRYGAGVKGKVCDAINSGVPVITTPIGNEGLDLADGEEALIANDSAGLAERLAGAFEGCYDLARIARAARKKLVRVASTEVVAPLVRASLIAEPVVIGMVTYNQLSLLQRCLEAVIARTDYPSFRIAVVSNGCRDGSKEYLESLRRLHPKLVDCYFNAENQYFIKPNNFIIRTYAPADIVLMNNDIEVCDRDWLTRLRDAAYSSVQVGAAGGLLLDQSGKVLEAGAMIQANGLGIQFGRGLDSEQPSIKMPRYVGYCSACLLYMKRSSIDLIGPLDEEFHPMYFEDAAWQYELHRHGIKTAYTPACKAIHIESASANHAQAGDMRRYQEINREKFLRKFKDVDFVALGR